MIMETHYRLEISDVPVGRSRLNLNIQMMDVAICVSKRQQIESKGKRFN